MNLFSDYVQPLASWLQQNPHWALFITFIVSLSESLAIVGSIIPGSVTMTAIGILAGSGIMRIDLTFLAATLGAVAGDSLSYFLGYYYSGRLTDVWPFRKYPQLIQYGKDFFEFHGGKSVLFGRFVGPLRSIIPLIAGILHMQQWRFLAANILSAIGWAFLYVMPGVIIGAAGHELSTEAATRLFVLILIILAGLWILSLFVKWIIRLLNPIVKDLLHTFWLKLNNTGLGNALYNSLTPKNEENHAVTASYSFITAFCLFSFMVLFLLTYTNHYLELINLPSHLFFQSLHTPILNSFFIFCTQLTSTATIITVFIVWAGWLIYFKKTIRFFYLLSLLISSAVIALSLSYLVDSPKPPGLLISSPNSSFPAINLLIATSLFGFILFYINSTKSLLTNTFKYLIFTILGLSGLGSLYLGDYWVSDILSSYFLGTTICLIHCLIYRKSNRLPKNTDHPLLLIGILSTFILLASSTFTYLNFKTLSYNHILYYKKFILREDIWWQQTKPLLPAYQLSRIGKRISLLNIQYAGSLNHLQNDLEKHGWVSHSDSFFINLLKRIAPTSNNIQLPLLPQLFENKAPLLIMTYTEPHTQLILEFRIWESSYNLLGTNKPLWIGSIHPSNPRQKEMIDPLIYLFPSEHLFNFRKITLPDSIIKKMRYPTQPYLILIKEK